MFGPFSHFIDSFARFIRWRDWGPGKLPVFFTVLSYLALANRALSLNYFFEFIAFTIFAAIHSALGYLLNDWGDRKIDKLHGKSNAFDNLSKAKSTAALVALLLCALLSVLPFLERPLVFPLWLGWLFFAFSYSLRPLRLKERGIVGLLFSSIAQWTIPILITFAAMEHFGGWDMLIFVIAHTVSGATLEIAHQRHDRLNDTSTGTDTFGARTTTAKLDRLYTSALFSDKISLGIMLFMITMRIISIRPSTLWVLISFLPLSLYSLLLILALIECIRALRRGEIVDPYYTHHRSANKLLHETMPNFFIPVFLLLLLTFVQPYYCILFCAFLFWRLVLGQADLKWPLRSLKAILNH